MLFLTVFSQVYIFAWVRRAAQSSCRPEPFKKRLVSVTGILICILFGINAFIIVNPVTWPAGWINLPVVVQIALFYIPAVWVLSSIFSAIILLIIDVIMWLARKISLHFSHPASAPIDNGRRCFLQAGIGGIAAMPLILSGYGASYESWAAEVKEISLPFGCPLRVVQVSDIHSGIYMTRARLHGYMDQVIALKPDIFVLTGDFISNSMSFLPGCLEEVIRVRSRYGTFAVTGNHDHWFWDMSKLQRIFRRYKVPILLNEHRIISTDLGRLAVAGIEDLASGNPDLASALEGLDPSLPTILLSHHPEIFPDAAGYKIALTLSGHYHGGQIKIKIGEFETSMAHLRTPYPEGLFRIGESTLYVNRGIGTTFTPVRINAPAEITVFNLA